VVQHDMCAGEEITSRLVSEDCELCNKEKIISRGRITLDLSRQDIP
jgi:hypothetical protein